MPPFQIISHSARDEQFPSKPFGDLRHYIGRLGEHLKVVKNLVDAILAMPDLLDNFKIETRRSSCSIPSPLHPDRIELNGIVGRMFNDGGEITRYRASLATMDRIVEGDLSRGVKKESSFTTRVHAELLLVDLFQEHEYDFVANDKYVGCSKPACYCCYHYIAALRGGFHLSMPACHNNVYLAWRVPDLARHRGAAAEKRRRDVMNTMILSIRDDLRRQVDSRRPRGQPQFDSMTGVTPLKERGSPEPEAERQDPPSGYDQGQQPPLPLSMFSN